MITTEALTELYERMNERSHTLDTLASTESGDRADHLRSKAEGVRLAMSYLRETIRQVRA